jgi:Xaa-Pro aminopeptidase
MAKKSAARSRTPHSKEFLKFISSGWAETPQRKVRVWPVAPFAAARRATLAKQFQGSVLVIEAGEPKVRSNDTDYRYRPHSAFAHLTGWGSETVPGSALVIDARGKKPKSTLYFRPTAGRETSEFFANPAIGEFWVGSRPDLKAVAAQLDIETRDLEKLADDLKKFEKKELVTLSNSKLSEAVSVLRFVKDDFEIAEMRGAVAATIAGFEDIAQNLERASASERGERIIEGSFFARARLDGNDLGYDTIAASGPHACILHWTQNNGPVRPGDLVLIDAGVELDSLYTADITRTLPVSGRFTELQRKIYEAVLKAADAAFAHAAPGVKFREVHEAAMQVIAREVESLGILPISAEDSLHPDRQLHRRWMVHGTSHHLGLDVHDCAQAKRELYLDSKLEPGMVFTIEPGLYFQPDDLLVPAELRGIGIRIEDDVLVTKTGVENLSAALPRKPEEIEAWLAKHRRG